MVPSCAALVETWLKRVSEMRAGLVWTESGRVLLGDAGMAVARKFYADCDI
jgi:hypothetical protein